MIEEQTLERLLRDAADSIQPPAQGAARVVAAAPAPTAGSELEGSAPRRGMRPMALIAAAVVLVVGAGAILTSVSRSSDRRQVLETGGAAKAASRTTTPAANDQLQSASRDAAGYRGAGGASTGRSTANATLSADSAKIVRTASLALELQRHALPATLDKVERIVFLARGYIADKKASESAATPRAELTVRVPETAFQATVKSLRALGKVQVATSRGQDVTAQYTDLTAQLDAARAEHAQLLLVLAQAHTIGDILAVRDRVDSNQTEINQLQGQINLIDDQASLSAISLALSERPTANSTGIAKPQTGISKAWTDARDGFANSVEWIIARSGTAFVLLVAVLLGLFALRYLYPVVRRGLL